ncbi:DUF4214 domain-containing protein [Marivita hallyeonensis]|uniref:Hemolysin-type calcium-binding repeat-containing protein n=1 Tax=Marivita hallyeonensis TaxID=996342 RepID=A0A1M5NSQ9_9RHOB|nr:DUF4214 domain-containing protein [Marivita hallyeonensis]SHG92644.1 Hemolysin-type calcium-binding repeat-containing protein [Marivita hallyeonensis]
MATVYLDGNFDLLNSFDHQDVIYPFYSIEFSPNLITVTHGGLGAFTNQYSGSFTQADNGVISGTVVGVMGHYFSDAISPDSKWPELMFMAQGMAVEFADFEAVLADDGTFPSPEALLLAENDLIYVVNHQGGYGYPVLRGYAGDDRIFGGYWSNDNMQGDDGDDELIGYGGNDTLTGGAGNDRLSASSGNNQFEGGAGDDWISGEPGYYFVGDDAPQMKEIDTAVFTGDATSYTITLSFGYYGGVTTVTDRVEGRDGTDTIFDIERLEFADRTIDWSFLTVPYSLDPDQIADLASLYIAYFDRAPDALGLYFWMAAMEEGMSLEEVSAYFATSTEAENDLELNGSVAEMVSSVFANVLNRAVDDDGLAFWTSALEAGEITRDAFVLEVLRGVEADPAPGEAAETSALRLVDNAYLDAKTNLGLYFAGIKGLNDVEEAEALFDGFDGSQSSIVAGKAMVDTLYDAAADPDSGALLVQFTGILDDPFYL